MRKLMFIGFLLLNIAHAQCGIDVCFTPGEKCAARIIAEIDSAQRSVFVQAYYFTSQPIADALVRARQRDIKVRIMLDKNQESYRFSQANHFIENGIEVIYEIVGLAHNKVMIIDDHKVITGSYNFTVAAEKKNTENVLFIDDPLIAERFKRNWKARKTAIDEKSKPGKRRREE